MALFIQGCHEIVMTKFHDFVNQMFEHGQLLIKPNLRNVSSRYDEVITAGLLPQCNVRYMGVEG